MENATIEYRAQGNPPVSPGLFIRHPSTRPERIAFVPADMKPDRLEPFIELIYDAYREKGAVLGRTDVRKLLGESA